MVWRNPVHTFDALCHQIQDIFQAGVGTKLLEKFTEYMRCGASLWCISIAGKVTIPFPLSRDTYSCRYTHTRDMDIEARDD